MTHTVTQPRERDRLLDLAERIEAVWNVYRAYRALGTKVRAA